MALIYLPENQNYLMPYLYYAEKYCPMLSSTNYLGVVWYHARYRKIKQTFCFRLFFPSLIIFSLHK